MNYMSRIYYLFILLCGLTLTLPAQDSVYFNLEQAKEMAANNNQLVKIFQYKIEGAHAKLNEMKSHYFPRLELDFTGAYNSNPDIHAKKGAFNHIYHDLIDVEWIDEILDEYFPLPPKDIVLVHGDEFFYKANLSLYQPISQLTSVNTGRKVAEVDVGISEAESEKVIAEIKTAVTELYYGILVEQKYEEAALLEVEYKDREYYDAKNAAEVGEILEIDVYALDAEINEKQQELLEIQNKKDNYLLKLKQLLNLGNDQFPVLLGEEFDQPETESLDNLILSALNNNLDLEIAGLTAEKAKLGIEAAKKDYIPELVYFMQYNQNYGVPLYPDSYWLAGFNLKWTLVAAGERKAVVRQREALENEALLDLEYKTKGIRNEVEKLYLDIQYAIRLIATAEKALEARKEEYRLTTDALQEGEILSSELLNAKADLKKAEADLFAAKVNLLIKNAELKELLN